MHFEFAFLKPCLQRRLDGFRFSLGSAMNEPVVRIALLLGLPLGPAALASLKQDGLWRLWRRDTLRFFYGVTLGHSTIPERIAYARQHASCQPWLGADEVVSFLEAIPSLKIRIALKTVYAAGLRASEVVFFKVADIDSQRTVIRVGQGKGGRDRYIMFSPQLLKILGASLLAANPTDTLATSWPR